MKVAIIAAAGKGIRMKAGTSKQYLSLLGKPLLFYTLSAFEKAPSISKVIVVTNSDQIDFCLENVVKKFNLNKVDKIIEGGMRRQDSVYNGLKVLPSNTSVVVIHDGARPLVTPDLIEEAISALNGWDGVVVGVPAFDTLKEVEGEKVKGTLNRDLIWQIQTPQIFLLDPLLHSYEKAYQDNFYATDDATLLERLGYNIKLIRGRRDNIKVTVPTDLILIEAILRERKCGSG